MKTTTTRPTPLAQGARRPLRQRLRTALTILGITWATTAVITLLAFGTGLQRQMVVNPGAGDQTELVTKWHSFDLVESLRYE